MQEGDREELLYYSYTQDVAGNAADRVSEVEATYVVHEEAAWRARARSDDSRRARRASLPSIQLFFRSFLGMERGRGEDAAAAATTEEAREASLGLGRAHRCEQGAKGG